MTIFYILTSSSDIFTNPKSTNFEEDFRHVYCCLQHSISTCEKQSGFVISRIVKTSDVLVIFFVILMFHSYANTYGWFISVYFLEKIILATDRTL